ncbi:hypothetical protein OIE68_13415 [Nocardia vinacea]|uniref:Uncharacterized protein n=1 Tax=Nocardia vinacea TaxID=96468 RepID=A0ABZ1YUI4_9NOCA|nr:hypothetical protein OIE68_13415 [Nocardia vinacea]
MKPDSATPQQLSGNPPRGFTALTAGVLAGLGAASHLFGVILAGLVLGSTPADAGIDGEWPSWFKPTIALIGLFGLAVGALLAAGAVQLFRRRIQGRSLVLAACITNISVGWIMLAYMAIAGFGDDSTVRLKVGPSILATLVVQTPAIITLILAAVPATKLWLDYRPAQPRA